MKSDFESLARRLTGDERIATPVLRRILTVVDEEIAGMTRQNIAVPPALRHLREVVARACLARMEEERTSRPDEGQDGGPA